MDSSKLLNEIGELIDKKLDPIKQDVRDIKEQLNTVEIKVELVNKRVEKAQEETIDALSELITNGYELHEERIKKIENQLRTPQIQ